MRFITHRRFNYIDAFGMVMMSLAIQDRNWIVLIVIVPAVALVSVLAERAQGVGRE